METLVQEQPETHNNQSNISVMPVPEQNTEMVDASSQPFAAGSKRHESKRCILNQLAQKLRKPLPVYQTQNEGYEHLPQFRSTVLIDGITYRSANTFQTRKMAEMDVAENAYIAIKQKIKSDDALLWIQEDIVFSKSILTKYGAKFEKGIPKYETTHLEGSIPVFRSDVHFAGVTYVGASGRTKKDSEQLAARAAILSHLDTEAGTDMAEVIICKANFYAELKKVQGINSAQSGANILEAQTGVSHEFAVATQPRILAPLANIPATLDNTPVTDAPSVVIQPAQSDVAAQTMEYIPLAGQTSERKQRHKNKKNAHKKACLDVQIQPAQLDVAAQTMEYIPLAGQTSERKRRLKNKKNAQKKCLGVQMDVTSSAQDDKGPSPERETIRWSSK